MVQHIHDASCQTVTTTATGGYTITLTCDQVPPRLYADEPRCIKVGRGEDGLQRWASFKTQCRDCRALYGGYWMDPDESAPWPPDPEVLRRAGARMLVADDCKEEEDGWLCAMCLAVTGDHRLRIGEAHGAALLEGWPKEG